MSGETVEYQSVRNLRTASAAVALMVCAFAAVVTWESFRDEQARQAAHFSAIAELGAQSLDSYFDGLQGAMRIAADELLAPDDRIDPARARRQLARLKAAFPELRIATLAALDGTIVASTEPIVPAAPATMAAQRTFVAAREERIRTGNRNLSIGRAFFGPLTREWVMPTGYGVWDSQGRLSLILGAGLPLAKAEGLWKDAPLPPRATMGLLRDDGYLLIRHPNPTHSKLEDIYGQPAKGPLALHLAKHRGSAQGSVTGKSNISGEETLFVYRRLQDFPLTFFVNAPTSNIVDAWWERVWAIQVLWLVLLLGGYCLYRWVLRRQLAWQREHERQVRQLRAANQALEDFAYTIAHDLKAPVRAVDAHAGIALEAHGGTLAEAPRQRLEQIRKSAARMAGLIDDLLEFSRYSRATVDRKPVDMAALARSVAAEHAPPESGIYVFVGELPACECDPALVRVVWNALVSNAVKYSAREEKPVIEIGYAAGEYYVRDNGVGFDMAHAEKLFGVFSRLHGDEFEGTGAGLAIARRILERHGGRISAHAEPGKGATFRFSLS